MSERSYVGKIVPLAIYPRGSGAAVSGLLMLGALLALLVAAWVAAFQVGTTALDRADARLASEARSASAGFSALVAAGDARAGTLAATPALQRAVLRRNAVGVRAEVDGASDVAVYGRGRLLAGRPPSGAAATRTVRVVAGGWGGGRSGSFSRRLSRLRRWQRSPGVSTCTPGVRGAGHGNVASGRSSN